MALQCVEELPVLYPDQLDGVVVQRPGQGLPSGDTATASMVFSAGDWMKLSSCAVCRLYTCTPFSARTKIRVPSGEKAMGARYVTKQGAAAAEAGLGVRTAVGEADGTVAVAASSVAEGGMVGVAACLGGEVAVRVGAGAPWQAERVMTSRTNRTVCV
jgi:hypothetical protein